MLMSVVQVARSLGVGLILRAGGHVGHQESTVRSWLGWSHGSQVRWRRWV